MIERRARIPVLAGVGAAIVVVAGGADALFHLDPARAMAAQGAHVVVLVGMLLTLGGILAGARRSRKEGR